MLCLFSIIVLLLRPTHFDCKSNLLNVRAHKNWPKDLENDCGISYADRIIGGTNASLGQYPWLARIGYQSNDYVFCFYILFGLLFVLCVFRRKVAMLCEILFISKLVLSNW